MLYRFRLPVAAIALLFILYGSVYMWFYVPPDDYEFTWAPDTELHIRSLPEGSLARPYLQADDILLTIGGRPVRRMAMLYPLPLRAAYTFTVKRGGEVLTYDVPVPTRLTALAVRNQLPTTLLSLAGWAVGALLLLFARRGNNQAVHAGYIFLFAPAVLVGIQAAQDGAPLAWIGGHALIFFLAVAWTYLGFIPRAELLASGVRRVIKLLLIAATGLALVAVYEVLFLFPNGLSMEGLYGVSMYSLGFLLSGLGLAAFVFLLGLRALRLAPGSYLRQQLLILLVFVAIGVLPIVFLTILPSIVLQTVLLPFPVSIALMIFIPAGYLFVIYRRGFLGLDPFFSRAIYLALLSLVVFGFYASGLYFVQRLLHLSGPEAVVPATVVFFPTLLLTIYLNRPINDFVQQLVYGRVVLNQETLAEFALALSARPELATLEQIVASLSNMLEISQAVLVLEDEQGRLTPVTAVGAPRAEAIPSEMPGDFHRPVLRAAVGEAGDVTVLQRLQWAELLVPVSVREEPIGVLALSRPGEDGYFNARQVAFLVQAAGVLAVASENIRLFQATRNLSMQALVVQEEERRRLSLQIHDSPLQQITYATNVLDHILVKSGEAHSGDGEDGQRMAALARANGYLREAAQTLRHICIGLYPPFRDQGLQVAVQEIVRQFREEHELRIELVFNPSSREGTFAGSQRTLTAVTRVLMEALNNVAKHVPDATVCVTVSCGKEELTLSVADDGGSFRTGEGDAMPALSFSELVRRGHLGIVGMHEWARYAGGSLRVDKNEPRGTRIVLSCPLNF